MAAGADGAHSPISQFEIKSLVPLRLFGFDTSFTREGLFGGEEPLSASSMIAKNRGSSDAAHAASHRRISSTPENGP